MFRKSKPPGAEDEKKPGAAATLRPLLYGDLPIEQWVADKHDVYPWDRFSAARLAIASSDAATAAAIWREIAEAPGLESRQHLQAWTFLRQTGHQPSPSEAKRVLGVVVEMPVNSSHDVLVAYEDGSCRYLNHSGKAAVIDDPGIVRVQSAIEKWLEVGRSLVQVIGPWDQPELPSVPVGHGRVMVLTPSGPHFGQGPEQLMLANAAASTFIKAATALLQVVVSLTVRDKP